jgi:hypothetical protein
LGHEQLTPERDDEHQMLKRSVDILSQQNGGLAEPIWLRMERYD